MKTDRHQKTSIRAKTRISLRWHYPNQVMGLNAQFTLSRFASSPVFFFSLLRYVSDVNPLIPIYFIQSFYAIDKNKLIKITLYGL
jgi:hypothetical protein